MTNGTGETDSSEPISGEQVISESVVAAPRLDVSSTEIEPAEPTRVQKAVKIVAYALVAIVCGLTFGFSVEGIAISMVDKGILGSRDFVVFWSTGQLLARHNNPYDGVVLLKLERLSGLPAAFGAMYMRNFPFSLPLVYPLGLLKLQPASILWSTLLMMSLATSVWILWAMHGKPGNQRHWLGYSFGPAILCIIMGQTSIFVLLGLVLFLRFHRSQPFCAGLALWLVMLKPHLVLPFGLALMAWIVVSRSYKILFGALLALMLSLLIAYRMDALAWQQYLAMARGSGVQLEFIPCSSVLFRIWISKGTAWVQYVPALLSGTWAVYYYWTRRRVWDWMKHGTLLLVVGLMTAPYSWVYDACIVIPALLYGAYQTRSRTVLVMIALLSSFIELALLGNLLRPQAIFYWTLWSAPSWFAWYMLATTPEEKWIALWQRLLMRMKRLRSGADSGNLYAGASTGEAE